MSHLHTCVHYASSTLAVLLVLQAALGLCSCVNVFLFQLYLARCGRDTKEIRLECEAAKCFCLIAFQGFAATVMGLQSTMQQSLAHVYIKHVFSEYGVVTAQMAGCCPACSVVEAIRLVYMCMLVMHMWQSKQSCLSTVIQYPH